MTGRSQSENESRRHSGENGKIASGFSHFNPESRVYFHINGHDIKVTNES
ncbi:MAG: hypothetical protein GY749_49800 [Desulfobacteraceae bacterium]|nr:hypothetical protein [Desulfobacteraceae bacterium]